MRAIDADALKDYIDAQEGRPFIGCTVGQALKIMTDEQPTIKPVIIPCDYAKACNEATMNKATSAVAYYDALEELRKHGYVLVDLREATE